MRAGYLVKIVPPRGYRVVRLHFTRSHLVFGLTLAVAMFATFAGWDVWTIRHAEARVGELRSLTSEQRARLEKIDAQAAVLDGELRSLRRQNDEIENLVRRGGRNARRGPHPTSRSTAGAIRPQAYRGDDDFATVAARIARLRAGSSRLRMRSTSLRRLVMHVLDVRRLQELARVRVLTAIPSLNPAGDGVAIRSPFGWRGDPWPEFHQGVDLDVDYGDNVRAAATGTVVAADYDGGYGIKIDIDHGNGYHTWYCHLSRADVAPGQRVTKAQHIALVGSTGESTGPHLHYQVMLDGKPVDPAPYLDGIPPPVLASLR